VKNHRHRKAPPGRRTLWFTAPMLVRLTRALVAVLALSALASLRSLVAADAPAWSRFRGPNGSGVSTATNVPIEFGPSKNLLSRLPRPRGHWARILGGDRIYLPGFRDDTLLTFAIARERGRALWERAAPPVKTNVVDKRNNPASPSPVVDDTGIYVFFAD